MELRHWTTDLTDPVARGEAYGRAWQGEIGETVRRYAVFWADWGVPQAAQRTFGAAVLERLEHWSPELWAELIAVARGAELPETCLGTLIGRTELLARTDALTAASECSTVAVLKADGARSAQTWDWYPELAPFGLLCEHPSPTGGVRFFTEPGMLGKIGVNAAGLGLHLNILSHRLDGTVGGGDGLGRGVGGGLVGSGAGGGLGHGAGGGLVGGGGSVDGGGSVGGGGAVDAGGSVGGGGAVDGGGGSGGRSGGRGGDVGVPVHALARHLLMRARTPGEAQAIAEATPLSASTVLTVVNATDARCLELSPAGVRAVAPEDGFLWHTNHFRHPDLLADDTVGGERTTWARGERLASCADAWRAAKGESELRGLLQQPPVWVVEDRTAARWERSATMLTAVMRYAEGRAPEFSIGPGSGGWASG